VMAPPGRSTGQRGRLELRDFEGAGAREGLLLRRGGEALRLGAREGLLLRRGGEALRLGAREGLLLRLGGGAVRRAGDEEELPFLVGGGFVGRAWAGGR